MQKELEFKIATSFSGEYRDNYVRPICNELLKMGLSKKEIFFDEWHDAIINGPSADDSLRIIYKKTLLTVVFLSEEYLIKNWTYNVEWNSIRQHINNGENQRIFLLGISLNPKLLDEITGLSSNESIYLEISDKSSRQVAKAIIERYRLLTSGEIEIKYRPKNTIVAIFALPPIEEFYNMEKLFQSFTIERMIALNRLNIIDYYNVIEEMLSWLSSLDTERLTPEIAKKVEDADAIIGWDKYQFLAED